MRLLTLAAGVAVGYVLGTRAGREKYEQIVEGARNLAEQPPVVQAKEKVRDLIGAGTDAAGRKIGEATDTVTHKLETVAPSRRKTKPVVTSSADDTVITTA